MAIASQASESPPPAPVSHALGLLAPISPARPTLTGQYRYNLLASRGSCSASTLPSPLFFASFLGTPYPVESLHNDTFFSALGSMSQHAAPPRNRTSTVRDRGAHAPRLGPAPATFSRTGAKVVSTSLYMDSWGENPCPLDVALNCWGLLALGWSPGAHDGVLKTRFVLHPAVEAYKWASFGHTRLAPSNRLQYLTSRACRSSSDQPCSS